jgi:hypothetical protein
MPASSRDALHTLQQGAAVHLPEWAGIRRFCFERFLGERLSVLSNATGRACNQGCLPSQVRHGGEEAGQAAADTSASLQTEKPLEGLVKVYDCSIQNKGEPNSLFKDKQLTTMNEPVSVFHTLRFGSMPPAAAGVGKPCGEPIRFVDRTNTKETSSASWGSRCRFGFVATPP